MYTSAWNINSLQAIMLSKLDYEEKKDVYKLQKKEVQVEKKALEQSKVGNKKQKKKNAMSLEQFNTLVSGDDGKGRQSTGSRPSSISYHGNDLVEF